MSMRKSLFLKSTSLAIMALALFAVSVESRRAKSETELELKSTVSAAESKAAEAEVPETSFAVPNEPDDEAKVLLLTMRPSGFEPQRLTLNAGKYLVVVRNRTGLSEFALRLERETGERLHEAAARRYQRDWKYLLQLPPGTYVLKETNHPEWICRITVTPR